MAPLHCTVRDFDYRNVPSFGERHLLARLGGIEGFPLFDPAAPGEGSGSAFLDRKKAADFFAARGYADAAGKIGGGAQLVIAGQQPGLLTGPLHTFFKAVSVISLSKTLEQSTGKPFIPAFWVSSEDHDILEINHCYLGGQKFTCEYDGPLARGTVPQVGDISLAAHRGTILDFVKTALPETEFTPWVLDTVASADFSDYAAQFSSLMAKLFAGEELVLIDARDVRELTGAALAAVVERWPAVTKAFTEGTSAIANAGFKPPLESAGLFEIVDGKRVAVEFTGDTVKLSKGESGFAEAAETIRNAPGAFSPGAALRPLVQDAALPVCATVAGPTELLYLWQIGPLYAAAGIARSRLCPRVSATFVEERIQKAARRSGAYPAGIFAPPPNSSGDAASSFTAPAVRELLKRGEVLLTHLKRLEGDQPAKWLTKSRMSIEHNIEKLAAHLHRAGDEEAETTRRRLDRVRNAVLPLKKLQERIRNIFTFLNLYGPE